MPTLKTSHPIMVFQNFHARVMDKPDNFWSNVRINKRMSDALKAYSVLSIQKGKLRSDRM